MKYLIWSSGSAAPWSIKHNSLSLFTATMYHCFCNTCVSCAHVLWHMCFMCACAMTPHVFHEFHVCTCCDTCVSCVQVLCHMCFMSCFLCACCVSCVSCDVAMYRTGLSMHHTSMSGACLLHAFGVYHINVKMFYFLFCVFFNHQSNTFTNHPTFPKYAGCVFSEAILSYVFGGPM
jgi:hypothetical protein